MLFREKYRQIFATIANTEPHKGRWGSERGKAALVILRQWSRMNRRKQLLENL